MENITIRPASTADIPQLISLMQALPELHHICGTDPQAFRQRIQNILGSAGHHLLVAHFPDTPIRAYCNFFINHFLLLPAAEAYLGELFVHPDYRDRGIGSALLNSVEQSARQQGIYRLFLVNLKSKSSYERKFYEKQGWQERDQVANFVKILQ